MAEQVIYILSGDKKPLSLIIPSRHTRRSQLLWFDEKAKETRALRFASNQKSIFQDEQDGNAIMTAIEFEDGMLINDPRFDATRIKFLEHHPMNEANGGKVFRLRDSEQEAQEIIDLLDAEYKATEISRGMDVDQLQDIAFVIWGKRSQNLKSKELQRDVLIYARNNPEKFLEMIDSPESDLTALITKALAEKVIQFRKDKTELFWTTEDNKKMMTRLPKGVDTMKALDTYFATDEGVESFIELEKLVS